MKHLFNRTAILLVVCAAASVTAFATTTSRKVTFSRAVTVNGTLVKAGTYKATFDDKTGGFAILDGKKVVAKSMARLETIQGIYQGGYSTKTSAEGSALISINMNSVIQAVIINDGLNREVKTP